MRTSYHIYVFSERQIAKKEYSVYNQFDLFYDGNSGEKL